MLTLSRAGVIERSVDPIGLRSRLVPAHREVSRQIWRIVKENFDLARKDQ